MIYKNITFATKTFYGVEFKPGEIHHVPGYINDSGMMKIDEDIKSIDNNTTTKQEPPKTNSSNTSVKKSQQNKSQSSNTKENENIKQEVTPNGTDSNK